MKDNNEKRRYKDLDMIGNHNKQETCEFPKGHYNHGQTRKIWFGHDWVRNENIYDWKRYSWRDENLQDILTFFGYKRDGGFSWGRYNKEKSDESMSWEREQVLSQALQDTLYRANRIIEFLDEMMEVITEGSSWTENNRDTSDRDVVTQLVKMLREEQFPTWEYEGQQWMGEDEEE